MIFISQPSTPFDASSNPLFHSKPEPETMMDEKILTDRIVVIRRSDRHILESGGYLNDRLIQFYFSYLSSNFKTHEILLLPPLVSSSLAKSSDPEFLKKMAEFLKLDERKLIFFPVKDNDNAIDDKEGSHWSLLVYYRVMHSFVHHDSMGGANDWRARKLYEKVKNLVGYGGSDEPLRKLRGENKSCWSEACFTECFALQPANIYDSGLYVMVIAETICEWFTSWSSNNGQFWHSALEQRISSHYVELNMRADILKLIDKLKEEDYRLLTPSTES